MRWRAENRGVLGWTPSIEYILGKTNISADVLSRLPNNGNQETTHESMDTTKTMSELYDIEELYKVTFLLYFNLINRYQQEDPILTEKLKRGEYSKGYFCVGCITLKLVTYKYKRVIQHLLQKYIVKWYHMYILHSGLDQTEVMI